MSDHYEELASGSVRALARWPVKSLGGEFIDRAELDQWGISGDRRYTVTDVASDPPRHLDAAKTPQLLRWTAAGAPVPTCATLRGIAGTQTILRRRRHSAPISAGRSSSKTTRTDGNTFPARC